MTAPTIVATAGATNANSYLTIAAANSIAEAMVGPLSWTTATSDTKARALVTATNGLETLSYIGVRTSSTQALAWPRQNATCNDKAPASTEIPRELELACFDLANALLDNPALLRSSPSTDALVTGVPNRDLSRLKLDVVELEWRKDRASSRPTPLTMLPHLATILGCLCTSTTGNAIGGVCAVQRS